MIAESLLIIVLLSYGACKTLVDGTSNQYQSNGLEALAWEDSGNLPDVVVPFYQDSEYLSCCASSIDPFRSTLRLDHKPYTIADSRSNALNFLSTRLIL